MNDAEAMRLAVARRQLSRMAGAPKTPDAAIAIVREAVEADPTLAAMGENILGPEEALELTRAATAAERPALLRELARRRLARTIAKMPGQAEHMDALGRGEADSGADEAESYADYLLEDLQRRGEL